MNDVKHVLFVFKRRGHDSACCEPRSRFSKKFYDEFTVINMLIFERSDDAFD